MYIWPSFCKKSTKWGQKNWALFLISVKSTYLSSTPPPPPLTLYKVPLRETIPETLTPNQPSIVVTKVSLKTFNHSTLFVSPTLSSKWVNIYQDIYETTLFRPIWPSNCARLVSNKYFFFAKSSYHPDCRIGTRCPYRSTLVEIASFTKKWFIGSSQGAC